MALHPHSSTASPLQVDHPPQPIVWPQSNVWDDDHEWGTAPPHTAHHYSHASPTPIHTPQPPPQPTLRTGKVRFFAPVNSMGGPHHHGPIIMAMAFSSGRCGGSGQREIPYSRLYGEVTEKFSCSARTAMEHLDQSCFRGLGVCRKHSWITSPSHECRRWLVSAPTEQFLQRNPMDDIHVCRDDERQSRQMKTYRTY
eukprot:COSAG02_NODE_783_length_17238_cov_173.774199_6_plen_197_part_00